MILVDLTHTSHTAARTGIQRVCRSLAAALARTNATGLITHDRFHGQWRLLEAWEQATLQTRDAATRRRAQWPWSARWRGRWRRWRQAPRGAWPQSITGIIVPEIFSPTVAAALPELFRCGGPRVALFHDAIPLRLPEFTPAKTVARFPGYLQELARFDGIAAVSQDSRDALLDYWRWLEMPATPPVCALPLGVDPLPQAPSPPPPVTETGPVVLCVGSIEGRKNHLALLRACEQLWQRGARFELRLIGLPRPETAQPALTLLRRLQADGRPLRFDGAVDDVTLASAYAACHFTVYPSLMEGFGLPVIESLQQARPCICARGGALGEAAAGGGCLVLETPEEAAVAAAIETLLPDHATRTRLTAEAMQRPQRSWDTYAAELVAWMRTVPVRPATS